MPVTTLLLARPLPGADARRPARLLVHARGNLRVRQRHVRVGGREHALQQAALAVFAVLLRRRQRQVREAAEIRVRAVQQIVQARRLRAGGCSGLAVSLGEGGGPRQAVRPAACAPGRGCPCRIRRRAGTSTRQRRVCGRALAEPAPAAVTDADMPHGTVFSAGMAGEQLKSQHTMQCSLPYRDQALRRQGRVSKGSSHFHTSPHPHFDVNFPVPTMSFRREKSGRACVRSRAAPPPASSVTQPR
jgi:hypothetical protein